MAAYDPWTKSAGGQWITFGMVQVRQSWLVQMQEV